MYKEDLTLDNSQWVICHKTKQDMLGTKDKVISNVLMWTPIHRHTSKNFHSSAQCIH